MESKIEINSQTYEIGRYPKTEDKTLKAWSSAELLALEHCSEKELKSVHIFNDRFGVWNCALHAINPSTIWTYASQKKAIFENLKQNNLSTNITLKTPLEKLEKVELALVKIPKSIELFELFLKQIHMSSTEETEVVCSFMTKYFSASFIKIAAQYFEEVSQSKAWKKARLIILKKPKKEIIYKEFINKILWREKEFKQFYGVFSSGKIDIGTQFLLENLKVLPHELKVLDLASGNGVIGHEVAEKNSDTSITLIDDFNLAIASSELNLLGKRANFICDDNLNELEKESFDLVVSNPPFHFEYENNIEVSLALFKGVHSCLKQNGRFVLVANTHLNYNTHLSRIFTTVITLNSNTKFVVYECIR